MWNMAGETVLHCRRMLPKKRSPGFGVTFETFQVDILGVDQLIRNRTVGVVAIRTLHFPFPYRMTRLSQQLGLYPFMTLGAHLRFTGLGEPFGVFQVRVVAI